MFKNSLEKFRGLHIFESHQDCCNFNGIFSKIFNEFVILTNLVESLFVFWTLSMKESEYSIRNLA